MLITKDAEVSAESSLGSSKLLKILFVTNMYPDAKNPGAGTFVYQQADYLRRAGHQVDVVHISGAESRLKYLTSCPKVFLQTRRNRYDVVHAHYGLSGVPALFRCESPLVITLHGSDALVGRLQPLISKIVCSFADAVIVVSKAISRRIAGEVIPCGVDLNFFRPIDRIAARSRLGLPKNKRLVLFPFNPLRKIKRYELAQAAVDKLHDPNVEILTVSGKPNDMMPWVYSASDVMILCSVSEGSPTSVKEALACNIPVVATEIGDVREIIEGIQGCEICDSNAEDLARGLRQVLGKGTEHFTGKLHIQRYDQSRIMTAVVQVYKRAIEGHLAGDVQRSEQAFKS